MKKLLYLFTFLATLSLNAQNVNIPDANFKACLVGNTLINTNGDTEIQTSEASAYTGSIFCINSSISDLTGIEAFTAILGLSCNENNLTSLDLSQNTALEYLYCDDNDLTTLDVSANTLLKQLLCSKNNLTSLDLSQNTALRDLFCDQNALTSLDLSQNVALKRVDCYFNDLTTLNLAPNGELEALFCYNNDLADLDISQSTDLNSLRIYNNLLSSLDLTNNPKLHTLLIKNNKLTSLDLSQNSLLQVLSCSKNNLVSLDLSQNPILISLECNYNDLEYLNAANGNNTNFTKFELNHNPIQCIQVDDAVWSTANWSYYIDTTASFSTNCNYLVKSITVQGQGGSSTITTIGGALQMETVITPSFAGDATYTWSVVNGTGSATISASGLLTSTAVGTVEVTATANDTSGVFGTKTITISNQTVGINNLAFENLNIYPNPTSNIINIENTEKLLSIKIMDLTGKTIKTFNADARQLDISAFTSGIYFLEIANAEKKSVIKIIKK